LPHVISLLLPFSSYVFLGKGLRAAPEDDLFVCDLMNHGFLSSFSLHVSVGGDYEDYRGGTINDEECTVVDGRACGRLCLSSRRCRLLGSLVGCRRASSVEC
jgi:hypothetical protein